MLMLVFIIVLYTLLLPCLFGGAPLVWSSPIQEVIYLVVPCLNIPQQNAADSHAPVLWILI